MKAVISWELCLSDRKANAFGTGEEEIRHWSVPCTVVLLTGRGDAVMSQRLD